MRPAKVVFMNAACEFRQAGRGKEGKKWRNEGAKREEKERVRMGLAMLIN